MENRYKKLLSNSVIFAIGSFGSKLITFFLLPLYTFTLTTNEFGITDLVQTTINLFLPIISISVYDSVLRFSMDKNENPSEVLGSGLKITLVGSLLTLCTGFILESIGVHYASYLTMILVLQSFQILLSQFLKALGELKLFAFNGILLTLLTAIFNLLFLLYLRMGVYGFFWAMILANLFSNIYLAFCSRKYFKFELFKSNPKMTKKLLNFSLPLIPNSIAWWAASALSRYFILFFLGNSANGIFAVSNKIPALLTVINSIFFQSWQLSAIEEYESQDREEFYSTTFTNYLEILFLSTSGILLVLKPLMSIIVADAFYVSWKFIPFLLLSVIFSSFSSFYGQLYIASKKTMGVLYSTILGSLINVIGNGILIPLIGLTGAAISSMLSFISIWIYRFFDTQKIFKTRISLKLLFINIIIVTIQSIFLFYLNGILLIGIEGILFLSSIFINKGSLISLINILVKKR